MKGKPAADDDAPDLPPYRDTWEPDDPNANLKADVANFTTVDPMPAVRALSRETGIPVTCLIRYVLAKWAGSAAEAKMAMGPIVLAQLHGQIRAAEAAATDQARLKAYEALRSIVTWLCSGE